MISQARELMRQAMYTLQHLLLISGAEQQAEESSKKAAELEDRDFTCIICMDAPREVAFLRCGHVEVCTGCSKLVLASDALCLMCRE